ncbi:hypothetical protein SLEP1_g51239 [Rubroshorea leprosula]|uniref:Retrotransposon gag domain-containing protein n=1 Tax=Rubroshorea leprosula TaxID=152421 RepID=A0AAV5M3C2_9ROSI|nr:hypothetical protein SLEP1_g51239 [Rubroshorea leprosula]
MPPKRNVGKVAQTLQIGLGEGSLAHLEGENEPIIPPPLSPILGEHSFVNLTFNNDSESGDDVAQSADMQRSNEESARIWHEQNAKNWRAFQAKIERMQEAFQRAKIEPQLQVVDLQRQNQNILAPTLRGSHLVFESATEFSLYLEQMEDLFHIQFYHSEPKVSMANLSHLVQRPGETSEAFISRFWKAKLKCSVALPEQEFLKLAQNGLDIELRKKFEGMEFRDFFELSYKVARYKNLLRDDTQRKFASHGTYYGDANFDLDVAEVVVDKLVVCPDLIKVVQQTNKTVKRYVDPFPSMSVGVNAADLRSIDRDKTQPYSRHRLAADDLRWVIEEARACRNQVRLGSYQRKKPKGHNPTQQKNNANQGIAIFGYAEKPRMVKPSLRSPRKWWEHVVHPKFPKTKSLPARRKSMSVRKEKGSTSGQCSPEKNEPPKSPTSSRVLAVESNEETGLKAKFDMSNKAKNSSDVIHFDEFSVNLSCLVITLPLVFQVREQTEVVTANDKPFVANTNIVEARFYDEDIETIHFFGRDHYGRPFGIIACTKSALDRYTVKEVVYEGEEEDLKDQITLEELDLAPAKLEDLKVEVQDPLEEVNLGLDRNPVEHRLPIREDFKPFKQPPRQMSLEVTLKVKEEIKRLLKNGKLRICVDFINLSLVTSKDEYPMPIADLLVDGAACHRILSFMDGHSGYNQIFIVEGDLVWKAILPPGKKDPRFRKWSPNWVGPFRIHKVLRRGAYWLKSLNGELHP